MAVACLLCGLAFHLGKPTSARRDRRTLRAHQGHTCACLSRRRPVRSQIHAHIALTTATSRTCSHGSATASRGQGYWRAGNTPRRARTSPVCVEGDAEEETICLTSLPVHLTDCQY